MTYYKFDKLMELDPYLYSTVVNQHNQTIELYENPIHGGDAPVIAVHKATKTAICTDFFDTADFKVGSDYNPIVLDEKDEKGRHIVKCAFEVIY